MATDRLTIEVEANTSGVDKLNESLKKLNNQLNRISKTEDGADQGFKKITRSVNGFSRALERINITPIERLAKALDKIAGAKLTGTASQLSKAAKAGQNIADKTNENLPSTQGIETSGQALPTANVGNVAEKSAKSMLKLSTAMGTVHKAASKLFSPLTKLISVFGRMILFNLVFRFLMLMSDAINVGITNLYQYSKALNNIDWMKTQQSMDDLAATAQQVKNSFGVTLMSVLVAIKPILDSIANAFINCANAINSFLAAWNGSTMFTKATKQAKEWGETTSSAAKKVQNATAGIDELNIISDSSGGGSGASTPDYSTMFEEVEVPSKIKDTVQWLQDHLAAILTLVGLIGAGLLAWKIMSSLPSELAGLLTWLGLLVTILGAVALGWGAVDAWMNGVDWTNTIAMIGGTIAIFGGLYLAFGVTAAAIGLLVGSLVMLVVGLHDIFTQGEMTTQTFVLMEAGCVALGVALGLLTGPIGVVIAAIGGLVVAIGYFMQHNETFKNNVSAAWELLKKSFQNLANAVVPLLQILGVKFVELLNALQPVFDVLFTLFGDIIEAIASAIPYIIEALSNCVDFITNILLGLTALLQGDFDGFISYMKKALDSALKFITNIILAIQTVVTKIADAIKKYSETVLKAIKDIVSTILDAIHNKISNVLTTIKTFVTNLVNAIKTTVTTIVTSIKTTVIDTVSNIVTTVTAKLTAFKTTIVTIFQGIWTGIKGIINTILSGIETMVNGVIQGLNDMINAMNSLKFTVPDWVPGIGGNSFGFNISTLSTISIPKLASGGMVEAGQLFIANEAGPELVGSMGGNTTVANNEQIIAGIQQGVEIAVSEILAPYLSDIAQNTRETADKDFSVSISPRDIAKANKEGQRSLGRTIISTV